MYSIVPLAGGDLLYVMVGPRNKRGQGGYARIGVGIWGGKDSFV